MNCNPGFQTMFNVKLLWKFGWWFWWFMFKMNFKYWWRWQFLWFFQYRYYWLTQKSFRKINREMKEYEAARL